MGLQSAMTTALTGLQAAETSIDVIGNNVANSNTVGFKASEVIFATQFLQTQSIGSAPSDTNGGTNPRQIGLGVRVAAITPNFNQGTIEISSNSLDLAIQGDGFLVVQGSQGEQLFTRNGQLTLNSENEVVTAAGNKLLGYGINDSFELQTAQLTPLEIPLGGTRVAQATTEAIFQGVLNPTVQEGTVPEEITSETLIDNAIESVDDANFDDDDFTVREAPSVSGTSGVGSNTGSATPITAGTYEYRITLLDDTGVTEGTPSTSFSVTLTGPDDTIDLSGIINEVSPWDGGVNIYRNDVSSADPTEFRQVGALSAADVAASVTTFQDTTDSATWATRTQLDTDALENGDYTYYITYYNSANGDETIPSSEFGSVIVNSETSGIRIDLSDLSPPDDADFNQIRIYRNPSGSASTFQLVDSVAAPGTGGHVSSYLDNTPTSGLSAITLDFDGRGSARAGAGTLLTDLTSRDGQTYSQLFEVGTLSFTGEIAGSDLETKSLEITAESTVQDLIDFMDQSLGLQSSSNVVDDPFPGPTGTPVLAIDGGQISISDGAISIISNYGEQNAVSIPLTAFQLTPSGSSVASSIPVTFSQTQQANGPGTTSEFIVYDSLGSPITVRLTTVLEDSDGSSTTYRWLAQSGDSQPLEPSIATEVGNGTLVFDSNGNLVSSPSASLSIFRETSAGQSPLEVDLDFSQVTGLADTDSSQNPVSSLSMSSQDGFPPGVLTDFTITDTGLIQGQFSNGTERTLGQVLMARFANSQGLRQEGNSLYSSSVNSGAAIINVPGEDGLGQISAGAVELSNTDIGQDLVEMILAQTQYQAGSRVIATAQELLDELLALQR